jgi:hypothetical protein
MTFSTNYGYWNFKRITMVMETWHTTFLRLMINVLSKITLKFYEPRKMKNNRNDLSYTSCIIQPLIIVLLFLHFKILQWQR